MPPKASSPLKSRVNSPAPVSYQEKEEGEKSKSQVVEVLSPHYPEVLSPHYPSPKEREMLAEDNHGFECEGVDTEIAAHIDAIISPATLDHSDAFEELTTTPLTKVKESKEELLPISSSRRTMSGGRKRAKRRVSSIKSVKKLKCSKLSLSPLVQKSLMEDDWKCESGVDGEGKVAKSVEEIVTTAPYGQKESEEEGQPSLSTMMSEGKKSVKRKVSNTGRGKGNKCAKVSVSPRKKNARLEDDWTSDEEEEVEGTFELASAPDEIHEVNPTPPVICKTLSHSEQGLLPSGLPLPPSPAKPTISPIPPVQLSCSVVKELNEQCQGGWSVDNGEEVTLSDSNETVGCGNVISRDKRLKKKRSSCKKMLMSNKSLLLDVDTSESSTTEKAIPSISSTAVIPTFEEVHKRQDIVKSGYDNKREETKKKATRSLKSKSSSRPNSPTVFESRKSTSTNKWVADHQTFKDSSPVEPSDLPPLVVERKTINNNMDSSTFMSSTLASSKKFFKTSFRENIESSFKRNGGLFNGKRKGRCTRLPM